MKDSSSNTSNHFMLPSDLNARPAAPEDVWDWQSYYTWNSEIWDLLTPVITEEVKSTFLAAPPEYLVSDDLSWLDDIVFEVEDRDISTKTFLAEELRKKFRAFRALHGTKAESPNIFFETGLIPLDPDHIHARARKIFLNGTFPELSDAYLEAAIKAVGAGTRAGRVWFEGNERLLVEHAGHYMLYGSEYLTAIAANMRGTRDYRRVLKEIDQPVVLICDVPLDLMSDHMLEEFSGSALEMVFQELMDGAEFCPERMRGAAFCIREALPAECVIGYYHPTLLKDPLT
nr:hypothetical protein [uncultured Roseibium sp.]